MPSTKNTGLTFATAALVSVVAASASALDLTPIGSYGAGVFDESAAEIVAYDAASQRLFVVNGDVSGLDVLDISDPTMPTYQESVIFPAPAFGGVQSVAVSNGIAALAIQNSVKQNNGFVALIDLNNLAVQNTVTVGALPDMLTFTPDGSKLLVANEGEPNDDYTVDPVGSVSIIDLSGGVGSASVTTAGFAGVPVDSDVRIFGPGASTEQDLEPEYITVSPDGSTAYVALQENNGLGILDLNTNQFTSVESLGFKDHSLAGQGLDANKNDDAALIENFPIFGMLQPDAITSYEVNGETYVLTANEGDAREYEGTPGFVEEADLSDITLDPAVFSAEFIARAADGKDIGDLKITTTLGNTDDDADYEEIYAYGGRSFSIFKIVNNGIEQVYDSGDEFEAITAALGDGFNATNDENGIDDRSDNKGPEPEAITLGEIDGKIFAFIGLERVGGIMVYDVTDPDNVIFDSYVNPRDFTIDNDDLQGLVEDAEGTITTDIGSLDLGPEGLVFISAADSPNGNPLLVVTNEVSSTTTIYAVPEPGSAALVAVGSLMVARRRRRA